MRKLKQKVPVLFLLFQLVIGLIFPALALASEEGHAGGGQIKLRQDADHSGSVFINVIPQPSIAGISAFADGTSTTNKLFAQDTLNSAEWRTTGVAFAHDSQAWNEAVLGAVGGGKGAFANGGFPINGTTFSNNGEDFIQLASDSDWSAGWFSVNVDMGQFFKKQSRVLTMTIPGWTAGNDVWNPQTISIVGPRKDYPEYVKIPSDTTAAASSIIDNLIGGYNEALKYFNSYVTLADGTKPAYDNRGLLNMMAHIANGQMPKAGSKIIYDPETATFSEPEGGWAEVELVGNPALHRRDDGGGGETEDKATEEDSGTKMTQEETPASSEEIQKATEDGVVLAYLRVKGVKDKKKVDNTMDFPFIVAKAPTVTREKYKGDVYALSFLDVLTSLAGGVYIGEGINSETSSNTSIVGDQINGFLYDMVTGALSAFNIKSADELVFRKAGNLFKNNAYYIYLAIVAPFIVVAIMILATSIADTFRKSQLQYINIQQAGEVQNSIGNVGNALLQIALLPTVVRIIVFLDAMIVNMSISLHQLMTNLIGYQTVSHAGFWGSIGNFFVSGAMNIIVVVLLALLNIKFTWRYIARAISFAMYFALAPIQFALDAFNGNGHFLQMGPRSSNTWKNLVSTVFMRSMDALGIVFATTIGRLLFGGGALVSILGYLAVEAITDAIRNSLGLTNANIRGLAEQGTKLSKTFGSSMAKAGGIIAGSAGVGAATAIANERNLMDAQQSALLSREAKDKIRRNSAGAGRGYVASASASSSGSAGPSSFSEEAAVESSSRPRRSENVNTASTQNTSSNGPVSQSLQTNQAVNAQAFANGGQQGQANNARHAGGWVNAVDQDGSPIPTESNAMFAGGGSNNAVHTVGGQMEGEFMVDQNGNPITSNALTASSDQEMYDQDGNPISVESNAGFSNNRFGNNMKRDDRKDHPDWAIPATDYDLALAGMNTDPYNGKAFNYGEDLSNTAPDPYLSNRFIHRNKEKQNIVDQYGTVISDNVDYTNMRFGRTRSYLDAARQGFVAGGHTGIAYDKNALLTSRGVGHQNKLRYSGSEHYGVDARGRIVPKTKQAKRERNSRLRMAALGGAASMFVPRNVGMTTLAVGGTLLAGMSDGKLDDAIVLSAYAKQLESRRTGHNTGMMTALGQSVAGRFSGIDPEKFAASRINTLSGAERISEPNAGLYANPPRYQSRDDRYEGTQHVIAKPNKNTLRKGSNLTQSLAGQQALRDARAITNDANASKALTFKNGRANFTQDNLRSIIKNPKSSPQAVSSAKNLMDEIGTSGVDSITFDKDRGEIGSVKDFQKIKSYNSEAIQNDASLGAYRSNIKSNPHSAGYFETKTGADMYQYDKETNSMDQYGESDDRRESRFQANTRADYRQSLEKLNTHEARELSNQMYETNSPEEYNKLAMSADRMISESSANHVMESIGSESSQGFSSEAGQVETSSMGSGSMSSSQGFGGVTTSGQSESSAYDTHSASGPDLISNDPAGLQQTDHFGGSISTNVEKGFSDESFAPSSQDLDSTTTSGQSEVSADDSHGASSPDLISNNPSELQQTDRFGGSISTNVEKGFSDEAPAPSVSEHETGSSTPSSESINSSQSREHQSHPIVETDVSDDAPAMVEPADRPQTSTTTTSTSQQSNTPSNDMTGVSTSSSGSMSHSNSQTGEAKVSEQQTSNPSTVKEGQPAQSNQKVTNSSQSTAKQPNTTSTTSDAKNQPSVNSSVTKSESQSVQTSNNSTTTSKSQSSKPASSNVKQSSQSTPKPASSNRNQVSQSTPKPASSNVKQSSQASQPTKPPKANSSSSNKKSEPAKSSSMNNSSLLGGNQNKKTNNKNMKRPRTGGRRKSADEILKTSEQARKEVEAKKNVIDSHTNAQSASFDIDARRATNAETRRNARK